MDSIEATLMAEGLHPLDVAWLEERIRTLEAALRALGLDYDSAAAGRSERQGDGWHYFACPTRHGFANCDRKCLDARAAVVGGPRLGHPLLKLIIVGCTIYL